TIPYVLTLVILGVWGAGEGGGGFTEPLGRWMGLLSHPEDFGKSLDLLLFLGIYLTHVIVGEMFFRKSLGKALLGLQVVMLDGQSPTVGAVLVRNLVRVPETMVGVALLYVLVSDTRQRLGDLLARTVVVGQDE